MPNVRAARPLSYAIDLHAILQPQHNTTQERTMSKAQDSKKETKKEPAKTTKEKKQAKKEKQETKARQQ
jgi:hypothetical protein